MQNLVFMMTDHQRADSLGMTQAGIEVTPNLNRLTERSTVFNRAYNTCPLCVPARTALATGKYPTANGVITNDWEGKTAQDHTTLHELLHQHGYDVGHIGVHHIRVKPKLQERLTFDQWSDDNTYIDYLDKKQINGYRTDRQIFTKSVQENHGGVPVECKYSNTRTAVWPGEAHDFKDLFWCRQAVEFIQRKRERPFALFLYLWAPHPPLCVPEPFLHLFDPEQLELPANVGCPNEDEPPVYRKGVPAQLAKDMTPDDWRRVWAAHLALVNMADTGIGTILDCIREAGIEDTTNLVFTSDHGDHLGQHEMYQKMEMYEQAIRVPLMFAGPNVATQSIDSPVSHLDIMPTLLELFDIHTPNDIDGVSLMPTIKNRSSAPQRPVFSQYSGNPVVGDIRRCVISGNYKYIWNPSEKVELFELESDPLEMNNLAYVSEYSDLVQQLHTDCYEWGVLHKDPVFA